MEIKYTTTVAEVLKASMSFATNCHYEFITPEIVLNELLKNENFSFIVSDLGVDINRIQNELSICFNEYDITNDVVKPDFSSNFSEMITKSAMFAEGTEDKVINVAFLVQGIMSLKESYASYILNTSVSGRLSSFMSSLLNLFFEDSVYDESNGPVGIKIMCNSHDVVEQDFLKAKKKVDDLFLFNPEISSDVNIQCESLETLIGREDEINKAIYTLCRCDNKNVLFVGEDGIGKRSIVYGLTKRINKGLVPKPLKNIKVVEVFLSSIVGGVQFRAEYESRIKSLFDSFIDEYDRVIIFIRDIHVLLMSGQNSENNIDIYSIFGSYLNLDGLYFIFTMTYDNYSKYFKKSVAMVKRFQRIDVVEPSVSECVEILRSVKSKYESFHNVVYSDDSLQYIVDSSIRYVKDLFLPEKAIDVMDMAGAYRVASSRHRKLIDKDRIDDAIRARYGLKMVGQESEIKVLEQLGDRMKSRIYGQDTAIDTLVEAVQLSKAGLSDSEKPIGSLLFVGPTGVGKTEVAKTLAEELSIPLVRFDMSEYVEKHTVAKLIGSPAGYVGYDDGGLLTEAIMKNPRCVLLLDEIEKAHSDIYNILLQVMDYGVLTDNKGQKANFQEVVIIMTSNAGAQYAHTANLGFGSRATSGSAMLGEVKKVFKPEFINRLTSTVVFNDMDEIMAKLILNRKIGLFAKKLSDKAISLTVDDSAEEYLLAKGISKEYGAREIDRVLDRELKPLFVKEILFGNLKNGGNVSVIADNNCLLLNVDSDHKSNDIRKRKTN